METVSNHGLFFFFFALPPSLRKTVSALLPPGVHFFGGAVSRERKKKPHTKNRLGRACINRFSAFFSLRSLLALGQVTGLL